MIKRKIKIGERKIHERNGDRHKVTGFLHEYQEIMSERLWKGIKFTRLENTL